MQNVVCMQAAGDIASVAEALHASELLNSNSATQVSPVVQTLLAHSTGPASHACGRSKSLMSTCELVLAVSELSGTLERHRALPASVANILHLSVLRSLSAEVSLIMAVALLQGCLTGTVPW